MEKKNLGRGLEEISDIFLSTSKKKEEQKPTNGFSAVTMREETCASCVNMIEGSSKEPKCKIFTFEHEKYGVPHFETISLNYANYCEYFESDTGGNTNHIKELTSNFSNLAQDIYEIEETVVVQKKIAYPDTEAAQKNMKDQIANYLETGYRIESIELKKVDEAFTPKGKKTKKEEIIILVKKDLSQ